MRAGIWSTRMGRAVASVCLALLVAACGGGGGEGTPQASQTPPPTPASAASSAVQNVSPLKFADASSGVGNAVLASVTFCTPGGGACRTVDRMLVDTGSVGVRVLSSALGSLALPAASVDDAPLGECYQYAEGYAWGAVRHADIQIAGEKAFSVPVHVMGDSGVPTTAPSGCSANAGPPEELLEVLRQTNGVLGIGVFAQDCGIGCAQFASQTWYYNCGADPCIATKLPVAQQVPNPVSMFGTDNNGTVIRLPDVSADGQAGATGQLIFGIGTQANNQLGGANVYTLNTSGAFTTIFNGTRYRYSFLDSGSSFLNFDDGSTPLCDGYDAGFYCPTNPQLLVATNQGQNGNSASVSFSVGNATSILSNPSLTVFNNIAAQALPGFDAFDWGVPFYLGRSVFTAIEGSVAPGGTPPYVAY